MIKTASSLQRFLATVETWRPLQKSTQEHQPYAAMQGSIVGNKNVILIFMG